MNKYVDAEHYVRKYRQRNTSIFPLQSFMWQFVYVKVSYENKKPLQIVRQDWEFRDNAQKD